MNGIEPGQTYPTVEDSWGWTRQFPEVYADWQQEVRNGDTLSGFLTWAIVNRPGTVTGRPR